MEGRHARMLGSAAFLLAACVGFGCYMFVVFHFHHVWAVMCVLTLLFCAIVAPALCFGYDMETPYYMMQEMRMSEQTFLNCRDLGWLAAGVLVLLTYVTFAAAWYGESLVLAGALVGFGGNACMTCAFMGWLRVFIFSGS